jgi:hypothetical protein
MKEKLTNICSRVDTNVSPLQEIVDELISRYCSSLDECMTEIDNALCDTAHPVTTTDLETYLLNLSSLVYWTGTGLEMATIKEAMSKMIREEKYNQSYSSAEGTIGDKTASAKLLSQDEELVRMCYTQVVNLIKHKIDHADDMAAAIKKIINHRTTELQQTGIRG